MNQLSDALATGAAALLTALFAALIAMLPQLWAFLRSRVHGERVLLLRETIASAAGLALKDIATKNTPIEQAIRGMVGYVRDVSLPETVKKLQLSDEQLYNMCESALYRAMVAPRP